MLYEVITRRFFTQPIFSERALRNLERAREALDAELLAGILPVLSAKNARYLAENVRGIALDPGLERRLEGVITSYSIHYTKLYEAIFPVSPDA